MPRCRFEVSFLVGKAGAQRAAVGSIKTHDGVGFLERIERRAADIQGVVVVFAGAVLGHDAVEQALRPAGQDLDFEEWIFGFERAGELAQIFAVHRRVPNDAAFVLGFAHQGGLAFGRRETIDLRESFFRRGGVKIRVMDNNRNRNGE